MSSEVILGTFQGAIFIFTFDQIRRHSVLMHSKNMNSTLVSFYQRNVNHLTRIILRSARKQNKTR